MRSRGYYLTLVVCAACGRLGFDVDDGSNTDVPIVQSGELTFPDQDQVRVAITPVPDEHSMLVFSIAVDFNTPDDTKVTGRLSSEELVFERGGTEGSVFVHWYVVTWSGLSVQRGSVELPDTTSATVAIEPVDVSRSFPIVTAQNNGVDFNDDDFLSAELGSNQLRLEANQSVLTGMFVEWQVVEVENAAVQHGTTVLPGGQRVVDASLTPVDPARTWLVYSMRETNDPSLETGDRMVAGELASPSMLQFERGAGGVGDITIAWSAIELADGRVQHGAETFGDGEAVHAPSIATVDVTHAFPYGGGFAGTSGWTDYVTDDNPGPAWAALGLTSTALDIRRGVGRGNAEIPWQVVELH